MARNKLLRIVNIVLALALLYQIGTVIGLEATEGSSARRSVAELHEIGGFTIIGLSIAHVILNWTWIRNNMLKRKARA